MNMLIGVEASSAVEALQVMKAIENFDVDDEDAARLLAEGGNSFAMYFVRGRSSLPKLYHSRIAFQKQLPDRSPSHMGFLPSPEGEQFFE